MWTFSLERDAPKPLHDQLAGQLRERIASGFLPAGTRLPPSRTLAQMTGVGRNTILSAYDILLGEGYLEAKVGRGTFVRDLSSEPPEELGILLGPREKPQRPLDWEPLIARRPEPAPLTAAPVQGTDTIRLDALLPDPATFPVEQVQRLFQEVLRDAGAAALNYGPADGYEPLREAVAVRVSEQGGRARPEDVLIVAGSQLGLDLVGKLLLEPGDTVLVGAPTYANVLKVWQLYGARILGVPLDPDGMQTDALEATLRRTRPKLLYVMPTFQNPTGVSMTEERSREIVELAAAHGVPILEDHFDSEVRFAGQPTRPLRAFDVHEQVMYLGTFSKMLFPGFRLGWLVCPPAVHERLLELRRTCELSPSLLPQMVAAEFCRRGYLDKHLARLKADLALRLEALHTAVEEHFPKGVRVTQPQGGLSVWVTLPADGDATELLEIASKRGVAFAPGTWFFADGSGRRNLRLTFGSEPADRVAEGVRRLGQAMKTHLRRRSPTTRPRRAAAPFL